MNRRNSTGRIGAVATVCILLVALVALSGCASTSPMKSLPSSTPPKTMDAMNGEAGSVGVTDASVQTCSNCAGKGMAPMVEGTAVDANGVQTVKIGVKDGYYTPNQFAVKAGVPVVVVYSGKAKGCLAKPQFKELGKAGDFTSSGTATVDLGTLKAGTYEFKCGMGMTGGKIVAQ
jgi:plastocyanin domain-containing protein